jgi:hypothetical protein
MQLVFHRPMMRMFFMQNGNIDRLIFDSKQKIFSVQSGIQASTV